jgi:glycosyltransferase involved in cell wall biosynthesis
MTDHSGRPRVVFWDTLPSPYGVEQYNLLADRGALDFSVWFCRRTDPDRGWDVDEASWRFAAAYVEDPSRGLREAHRFVGRCRAMHPDVVVSPYGERGFVAGHAIFKALGIRTVLVVMRTFEAWVRRAWWKELLKALLFRSADAAHVPGPDGAQYARRYGFPDDRIVVVRRTTNVAQYARRLSDEQRREERACLGVDGCVFLYVGRVWKPKGLLHLVDAFRRARAVNETISLLLVGDGPDEREIRTAANGIPGITFRPFVQAAALHAVYAAADVFVFPTLGDPHGLVIEEAHSAGLPVITSDAAGDVHLRVVDGVTGLVVPAGDAAALARGMLALASNPGLRRAMGMRGAERVPGWDHDTYAAGMEQLVGACMGTLPRATAAARILSAAGRIGIYAAGAAGRR